LKNFGILLVLSLLPIITFRTSLLYLPTNEFLSILKFIIWIVAFILIYFCLKKYNDNLEKIVAFLVKNKILFFTSIIVFSILGVTFLYFTEMYGFSNEFLTDSKLIFNWDMYSYMLNEQFKPYMAGDVYYLGLIGFVFSLVFVSKKQKRLLFSFFFGALLYWILASKAIFFHNYYTNVIMITFCLSVGMLFYYIGKSFKNRFLTIIFFIFICFLIFLPSYRATLKMVGNEKDQYVEAATQYLVEKTDEDEIYIDTDYHQYLTLLSNRAQTRDFLLDRPEIKKSIKEIGFSRTMHKYNISYIVTTRKELEYERYANLFTDEDLKSISYKRTDIILSRLDSTYQYFPDIGTRNELIEKYDIKDKIVLEKEIGPYKFFKFVD
jgi:hypothetical protein